MRHFFFRLILGIIFLIAAFICVIRVNTSSVVLLGSLGIVFLLSAFSIRRNNRK